MTDVRNHAIFISSFIISDTVPCLNWFQMFRKTPNSFNEISASFRFPPVIFLRNATKKLHPWKPAVSRGGWRGIEEQRGAFDLRLEPSQGGRMFIDHRSLIIRVTSPLPLPLFSSLPFPPPLGSRVCNFHPILF